jgi:sulfate transport system ATP-binding protein
MQDGRASVGAFAVEVPAGSTAKNGAAVQAFVRPHDVKLTKAPADGAPDGIGGVAAPDVSVARVERLAWLGGYVKLVLKLSDGSAMTVEMQRNEIELLGIGEGDLVMADLRQAKVFVEDYSI